MKPISFPKLTLPDPGSRVAPTLGHPLVDDYLESVHARLRRNSTLVVVYDLVYDLKVFFTVIDVDPLEVRRRHVLEFIRVQRTGSSDRTVIPIDQSNGLALSTIRRRLSTVAGFYSHLCALGELDHNPVQRGMPVRAPVTATDAWRRWFARCAVPGDQILPAQGGIGEVDDLSLAVPTCLLARQRSSR